MMKKFVLTIILVSTLLVSFVARAVALDITTKAMLAERNTRMTVAILFGAIAFCGFSFFVYGSLKRLQAKTAEIDNFNQLRKAFIDADQRLIYLKDDHLRYVFVNEAMLRFLDKQSQQVLGYGDHALIGAEFAAWQEETELEVLQQQDVSVCETRWQGRTYQATKFPIELLNGNYGVGGYIEDTTEASQRGTAQEKTTLRYAILVDMSARHFSSTQEQLDYALVKALELTESEFGYVYLYDEERCEFTLNTWSQGVMAACDIADKQTEYQLAKTGVWGEAVRQRRPIVINDFAASNAWKRGYPDGHVQLSKFMTVPVIHDDHIVAVVGLANKEFDYDDNDIYQVSLLMTGVWTAKEKREKDLQLQQAHVALAEHKEELQLILDSTAEAIYGLDLEGNCTFCNASCVRMLGYEHPDELIGKSMHLLIHHSWPDGTSMPLDECLIYQAFQVGKGTEVDDEVFWKADGTSFPVEYFSYPQLKDGHIVGAVVTFLDITERKQAQAQIEYLSYHDSLTGLYNRAFFEQELRRLDSETNFPLAIIVGDVSGLKLTNDVFGHAAGDLLLQRVAEVLRRVGRPEDIISRTGGDEFVVLLPRTKLDAARDIAARIKDEFSQEQMSAIRADISLGYGTKERAKEDIRAVLEAAEKKMYLDKAMRRTTGDVETIETIISTLHSNCPEEQAHAENVSAISVQLGEWLGLAEEEVRRLRDASFLHDIGKIIFAQCLLDWEKTLSERARKELERHPVVGYRILYAFAETLDLAEAVLCHHEDWDGSGYPKGLKGEEIPKLARIIALGDYLDRLTVTAGPEAGGIQGQYALRAIKEQAGKKFDPDLVQAFECMLRSQE